MNMPTDDAQRELEQRALRNVRGLVDKVESQDQADQRSERRMIVRFAIGVVVVIAALAGYLAYTASRNADKAVTIESNKP
jgi:hypothetical protein